MKRLVSSLAILCLLMLISLVAQEEPSPLPPPTESLQQPQPIPQQPEQPQPIPQQPEQPPQPPQPVSLNPKYPSAFPIILVHGFSGWGRDEMLGYKYWGGATLDIEQHLQSEGFPVMTASVGPISSNHDRACELFYQIKGGKVDYGKEHSELYGHHRLGKTFSSPLYPLWDAQHPIHLVGHSMGGQTVRVLVELLAQDYFHVGTNASWVKSVTTISTPNNGTTLATMVNKFSKGLAEELVASFLGLIGQDWKVYQFDMEQWDIQPTDGETMSNYLRRIDMTIGDTKDISLYDLLPEGAQELNKKVRTFPQVYYFSIATEQTKPVTSSGHHWPEPKMNPMFWAYAHYMGHYEGPSVSPANDWWQNDGVVNTISMKCPINAVCVDYNGTAQPGVWNFVGVAENRDHGKIVGHYQNPFSESSKQWLKSFYHELAEMVCNVK